MSGNVSRRKLITRAEPAECNLVRCLHRLSQIWASIGALEPQAGPYHVRQVNAKPFDPPPPARRRGQLRPSPRRGAVFAAASGGRAHPLYWAAFVYHFFLASEISMLGTSIPLVMSFAKTHAMSPLLLGMIWTFAAGGTPPAGAPSAALSNARSRTLTMRVAAGQNLSRGGLE